MWRIDRINRFAEKDKNEKPFWDLANQSVLQLLWSDDQKSGGILGNNPNVFERGWMS